MKNKYAYNNYVRKLAEVFNHRIEEILTDYSFEYGDEFEIALVEIFRKALPNKYGVERGSVVDFNGKTAGDDIYSNALLVNLEKQDNELPQAVAVETDHDTNQKISRQQRRLNRHLKYGKD